MGHEDGKIWVSDAYDRRRRRLHTRFFQHSICRPIARTLRTRFHRRPNDDDGGDNDNDDRHDAHRDAREAADVTAIEAKPNGAGKNAARARRRLVQRAIADD